MAKTHVCSFRTDDPALGILLPETMETNEVFDDRDGTQQRSTNTERSVGRQLISSKTIPHAKIQSNGHEDAVQYDQGPEPEDGLLPCAQRVFQRRRSSEVGVVICDLCMGKSCVQGVVYIWRDGSAGICTSVDCGCAVIGVGDSFIAWNVKRAICRMCCRRT